MEFSITMQLTSRDVVITSYIGLYKKKANIIMTIVGLFLKYASENYAL